MREVPVRLLTTAVAVAAMLWGRDGTNAAAQTAGVNAPIGKWALLQNTMSSGSGLYIDLEIRPDGTYDYMSVFAQQGGGCSRSSGSSRPDGRAVRFSGHYRLGPQTIEFIPTSGKAGCVDAMRALEGKRPGIGQPTMGDRVNFYRIVDGKLCLRAGPGEHEICLSKS